MVFLHTAVPEADASAYDATALENADAATAAEPPAAVSELLPVTPITKVSTDIAVNLDKAACMVKVLCPHTIVGGIIGKSGSTVNSMIEASGARIRVSQAQEFYPGTGDRTILITGGMTNVLTALQYVIIKTFEVYFVLHSIYLLLTSSSLSFHLPISVHTLIHQSPPSHLPLSYSLHIHNTFPSLHVTPIPSHPTSPVLTLPHPRHPPSYPPPCPALPRPADGFTFTPPFVPFTLPP
jgi:hypothetical protein